LVFNEGMCRTTQMKNGLQQTTGDSVESRGLERLK